jgi:release factor glutamine methyltransferase
VVVANLPYVPSDEVRAPGRGLDHEPLIALDGGTDGLVLFRRLFAMVRDRVAPGGTLLLEIGMGQADDLRSLAGPGASVLVERDLSGLERVVRVDVAGTGA